MTMKQSHRFALSVVAALGLGIAAAAADAHPGQMGSGMGHQMMGGMQHGMAGGMGAGAMKGGPAGSAAAQQLMTPDERTALMEKMRNARTPEERQQIATATHAEMQKRAQEKGITLPEQRGPRFGTAPQAPGNTDRTH
jgi:hypothetical protein